MEPTDFNAALVELTLFREAYRRAALRASRVHGLLSQLQACRLWLPREQALSELAQAIYSNASYDACERYDSVAEFMDELTPEVDEAWPTRELHSGVDCYVLQPFLAEEVPYLAGLRFGYFQSGRSYEFSALDVDVPGPSSSQAPTGLSLEEVRALTGVHRSRTLALVNKLRVLTTALQYVVSDLTKLGDLKSSTSRLLLDYDGSVHGLVSKLLTEVELPFSPAPAKYFGTDADRTNPLKALPSDSQGLRALAAEGAAVATQP